MKKRWIPTVRILLLILLSAAAAFIVYAGRPDPKVQAYVRTLSDALMNARSVTLVEFHREWTGPELVFKRISASPRQIDALRSATGAWFAPSSRRQMNCFEPHHRVEIVRADSSLLKMEICFHCQNFVLGNRDAATMPVLWSIRLARFFSAAGMPSRKDYTALAKKQPDYHLIEEARRPVDGNADRWQ